MTLSDKDKNVISLFPINSRNVQASNVNVSISRRGSGKSLTSFFGFVSNFKECLVKQKELPYYIGPNPKAASELLEKFYLDFYGFDIDIVKNHIFQHDNRPEFIGDRNIFIDEGRSFIDGDRMSILQLWNLEPNFYIYMS